jgi:hypothetical protein
MSDEILYALGTALVGAITILWRVVIKRANDCERKHEKTSGDLLIVTKEVGELKGKISIAENLSPKLDQIHQEIRDHLNK